MAQQTQPIRIDWPKIYTEQHAALSPAQIDAIFARAAQWSLGDVLAAGGVVVFPHAAVLDCGYQVAAAVNAALDSGASKVLVVSVLHAWTREMSDARNRVAAGEDLSNHPLRGIQGPELPNSRNEWRLDHAMISWRFFWNAACERRGLTNPKQRPHCQEVYPFLAGNQPQTLPNYEEVAKWAEDAAIVSTADPFHHGIGYGDTNATARAPQEGGLMLARASVQESNRLLASGDYEAYLQQCVRARNDARDAGPLFRELKGTLKPEILDLTSSDMAVIYEAAPPTWVACALTAWRV
jgi:hypothetical protein